MAQAYNMDARAFEALEEKSSFLSKQLLGDRVIATEVFTGPNARANHDAMDARLDELERTAGAVKVHRARIGRNSPCLCGSGLKFKKCCVDKARITG
jgi:uncharacterized protein YchJ